MMECPICGGELKSSTTSYTVNRRSYHLIVDDVPAWVCSQCGEPLFTEAAVALVQDMVRELDVRHQALRNLRVAA